MWVANADSNSVWWISPVEPYSTLKKFTGIGTSPSAIAIGGGYVWVANTGSSDIVRIDPSTRTTSRFDGPPHPGGILYVDGSLWVTSQADATISRLDPTSGEVTQAIYVGNGASAVAASPNGIWVANSLDGTVSRIDPATSSVTNVVPVQAGPDHLVFAGGSIWVSNRFAGTISQIDPGTARVTRSIPIENSPRGLAAVGDSVWVAAAGLSSGQHRGGTVTVGMTDEVDSIDPARAYQDKSESLLSITNDGLLTFERVAGTQGGTIVPDLAVSVPAPSHDGLTYTFHLRPGIKYSNGQQVRAGDVRASLERVLETSNPSTPRPDFYAGIVGAGSCGSRAQGQNSGEGTPAPLPPCDLSKGIVTDDATGTVTFHLTAPDPEFVYKLAVPFASILPSGTPPGDANSTRPLPATGPYMITSYDRHKVVELARNPSFHEWSGAAQPDGFPDHITFLMNLSPDDLVDRILNGSLDASFDTPPANRIEDIRAVDPGLLHPATGIATSYFLLNTRKAPFSNVDARRAVNLAANRGAWSDPFGNPATTTCQVLPPGVPGYHPYCPYTVSPNPKTGAWSGPDLATARRLVRRSGTAGTHVTIYIMGVGEGTADRAAATLRSIGYPASVKVIPDTVKYFNYVIVHPHVQMAASGWIGDYPAPSTFFRALLTCDGYHPGSPLNQNYGGFCDPKLDTLIAKAIDAQLTNPTLAIQLWAKADRTATDEAAWLPIDNPKFVRLSGKGVGGYSEHPVWGMLVDQMWVR
ncbi:MAG: ABC transporter substrate-binding protein [Actinomycetota bacterium]